MQKFGILVGIAVAVIAAGSFAVYAYMESDTTIPTTDEIKDVADDIKEDIRITDPEFGQVEEQEGAYSP